MFFEVWHSYSAFKEVSASDKCQGLTEGIARVNGLHSQFLQAL